MGKIDVLVNAAGINKDLLLVKTKQEDIISQLNTNLVGTIFTCKAVVRSMMKSRKGCIINIGTSILVLLKLSLKYNDSVFLRNDITEKRQQSAQSWLL